MEKEWLIRTQHNQILGPVSKEKIKHLINENTLTSEDEISSGNGFWFKVKEKELVEKYVFGDFVQGFNPMGEAEDVLTAPEKDSSTKLSLIPIFLFIFTTFFINLPSADAQTHLGEMFKKKIFKVHHPLI
jgi:hypothetical protein